MALGIWDYFYKNRGSTSKGVDSKITYKLLIKTYRVLSWVKTLIKRKIKYKYLPCKIKSEWIASFSDGIQRRECQYGERHIQTENHRLSGQQKFQWSNTHGETSI